MRKVIAVFNNRNQTMQFASFLKRMGVYCKTISTPRELSVSCGLSVEFEFRNLDKAKYVLKGYSFAGFKGFYRIEDNGYCKKYVLI